MRHCRNILAIVWLAAALAALCAAAASGAADEPRIAILVSHKGGTFAEVIAGFHRHLRSRGLNPRYETFQLEGDPAKATGATRQIRKEKFDLLLALGDLAAEAACEAPPGVPIVAGMILRGELLKKADHATGVYLEFPPEIQFRWVRQILPEVRNVGVLYNAAENRARIETAARAARSMGLELVAREIHSPKDIPAALESLRRNADALWIHYDSVAVTPETARHILLFSFRTGIPVIGLSASWAKAGALYSLEWDYADVGIQCGQIAAWVLDGNLAGAIAPSAPRKVVYVLNMNTARQLKIEFPDALVRGAHQLF